MTHPRFLFIAAAIVTAFSCGRSDGDRIEFRQIHMVNRHVDSVDFKVPVYDVWSVDTTEDSRVALYFIVDCDSDTPQQELADSVVNHFCRQLEGRPIEFIDMLIISYIRRSGYTDKLDTDLWTPTNYLHPDWADKDDIIIEYVIHDGFLFGDRDKNFAQPSKLDHRWKPHCLTDYVFPKRQQ